MGSKKAKKMLDDFKAKLICLSHAVGAVRSSKEQLDKIMESLQDKSLAQEKWNQKAKEFQKCRDEMKKKWGEWPKYETKLRAEAKSVKDYCDMNAKKHKMRPLLIRDLKKIKGKVDDFLSIIDESVTVLKGFEASYKAFMQIPL